jgi:tRNA threonylcarbamoyladenosine biosynthesis protein TsaB
MQRALAIETSGREGSIAAVEGGGVVEAVRFPHGLQHAAQIVPIIDGICSRRGWGPGDVQELYVSVGPGSFTGLRIAVTLAKTMALATGVKLVAVPSAAVLVRNAPPDAQHVIIVLDAKRGQIFTARFERHADQWIEREPAHLDRLADMIARSPQPVHLIGEGIPYHRDAIPAHAAGVIVTEPNLWRARAEETAAVGQALAAAGQYADPMTLAPIYIRLPEAEEKWLAAQRSASTATSA